MIRPFAHPEGADAATDHAPLASLNCLGRAFVASAVEFWARSAEVALRHGQTAFSLAGGRSARSPAHTLTGVCRHCAAEVAMVPWLAMDRFRIELSFPQPRPSSHCGAIDDQSRALAGISKRPPSSYLI